MKSIKTKILLTFCITAAVIILAITVLISLKLGASIRTQSQLLSKELTAMSNTTLTGYHGVFKSTIQGILKEIDGLLITVTFAGYNAQTDKIDFTVLFDLKGNYISSTPSKVSDDVDIRWIEEFYRSSQLWKKIEKALNTPETELTPDETLLHSVKKTATDFIKAFQLPAKNFPGNTFLNMQSAKIIRDSFKEPLAVVIAGKIINNYRRPLDEFHDTTGLAAAVYINGAPIVQVGFSGQDKEAATAQSLQLPPEIMNEIYAADKPKNLSLTLAGKKYRSACSAIVDAKGEKIGALMVAMPEQVITEIDQRVSRYGTAEKRKLQLWLLGFGIAALAALVVISMIIANRLAQPLLGVVTLANAIAGGDLTQRLNLDREDEIGHMATALDNSCKNLSGMIARIKGNADMLASAAEEMSTVSAQMASSAEEMSAQSGTVAGATEQMSANINSMASAAEEMSVNVQSVSSTAEEMSQNMDAVASAIEEMSVSIKDVAASAQAGSNTAAKAAAMTTSATETMTDLSTAAREIDKVTSLIKRIAGLPNETLDIRNGDLYINDKIARKPPEVQEDLLVPVFGENRDLIGDLEGDPREGLDAFETVGDWTEDHGRYLAAPGEDGQARLSFRRAIPDEYPGGAQRADGIEVGDLVLEFTVVPAKGCGAVGAELRENEDCFDVLIPVGSSGRTVLLWNKEEVGAANGVFLRPGKKARIRFQNLDDRLALLVDDEVVLTYEVTDPSEGDSQPVSAVELGVADGGAAFEDIVIRRDIYYRSEGSLPTQIPENHYFMLGDNSGNSADSRGGWTVAENRLVGRPLFVIWPWDRAKVVR